MPTNERLNELFTYDKETGILYAKVPRPKRPYGSEIGCLMSTGYLMVRVDVKPTLVHRIIWQMHYGSIPADAFIDHIDGNPINNRVTNLRLATNQENQRNAKLRSVNKSGVNGVRSYKGKYRAQIKLNDENIHLGTWETKEEAAAARQAADVILGYHPNHGKRPR